MKINWKNEKEKDNFYNILIFSLMGLMVIFYIVSVGDMLKTRLEYIIGMSVQVFLFSCLCFLYVFLYAIAALFKLTDSISRIEKILEKKGKK